LFASRNIASLVFASILAAIMITPAYALQTNMLDPNLQITLEYPGVVRPGDKFVLSAITKAMTDNISNITLSVSSPEFYLSTILLA
jgi:hypothetical protein